MSEERLAWILRTIMVVSAAVSAYLLVQTEVELEPWVKVALGCVQVVVAALNPVSVASKVTGSSGG